MPRLGPKDYRAIGHALRAAQFDSDGLNGPSTLANVVQRLADVFERDNPRFDRMRFLRFVETGKDTRRALDSKTAKGEDFA